MNSKLHIILFLVLNTVVFAQNKPVADSIVRYANIGYDMNGNEVSFLSETPPLQQIAGAPKAYYSYFWEFGDGNYSLEKDPKHVYPKKGEYEVKLWATNNYDTGKPPATRPKKVVVNTIDFKGDDIAAMDDDFSLKRNREPMIDEEMVMIVSYKNPHNYVTSGEIHLYYNERIYKDNNFLEPEIRMYHGESLINNDIIALQESENPNVGLLATTQLNAIFNTQQVQDSIKKTNLPLSIEKAKEKYKSSKVVSFNEMQPGEERNVFLSMRTAPEMIKDTSAIIAVRGIYVSDKNYTDHSVKEMEMEIVTSHDPNKMSSNGVFINYRLARFKRLKYKIKFQNNGEGPARTIRLETDIPEMLDLTTLKVEEMYPECPICPKEAVAYSCLDTTLQKNKAIFTFKNIYLPGSEQKNVMEYDSTKGFVKYSIKFAKDFHKKKTKSRTAIIFDKNEPIITNYATTRFLPGLSIGIKAGYNYYPDIAEAKSYFISAVVSPYKPYRFYVQGEWSNSLNTFSTTSVSDQIIDNSRGVKALQRTRTRNEQESVNWEVPVLLRYNLNNYLGLGIGLQGNFNLTEKNNATIIVEDYENETDQVLISSLSTENSASNSFSNFKAGIVLDGTLGFARLGPSIGARYVLNTKANYNYWQLYAIFRF